jgi:hypothetical protein
LGTGGAYFDASGDTASRQVYLKYLSVKLRDLAAGLDVQAGRFGYASGAEAPSGIPKIETVKRQRVDSRLIGEFEWSLYQRSFDGARADYRRGAYQVTAAWLRPTQGGFEEDANAHMARVNVGAVALSVKPGAWIPRTDMQLFLYRYDDTRSVRARPDNSGRGAPAVDVGVTTIGASLVSAQPAGKGELDTLLWSAGQFGDWYGDEHAAWAIAAEAGYQWSAAAWRPWVRGGLNFSSGDGDPGDASHGTFFQMLPTARKYAFSAVYTQMNLRDVFAQIILRPLPALSVRADLHGLDLASEADRWYFGSGAIQNQGAAFGFGTRTSGGARALGSIVEGSVEYAISPHWTVGGYAGRMAGGDVVESSFAGDRLTFAYVESLIQF